MVAPKKPTPGSLSKRSTPKPMPVKPKGMDSKAYAKRLADAKKKVAMIDPKVVAKVREMYKEKPTVKGSVAKTFDVKKLKPKQISKSEQNFLDGQKLKKRILKKTGVYKNTAT
jgi:hypothetical protein